MTRAVVYARYSSDNQRDASIEDQVRQCRARIEQEGWQLETVYSDHAISGATTLRPGYQKMLEDARAGRFEVLVGGGPRSPLARSGKYSGPVQTAFLCRREVDHLVGGRGRRITCRPQGHHERPIPEGPRPKNPARPGRPRASGQVWRWPLLRL